MVVNNLTRSVTDSPCSKCPELKLKLIINLLGGKITVRGQNYGEGGKITDEPLYGSNKRRLLCLRSITYKTGTLSGV